MEKRLLNIKEFSEYTGLSKNTIYSWIWLKRIPYIKLGRLVRFDLREIDAWIEDNRVEKLT